MYGQSCANSFCTQDPDVCSKRYLFGTVGTKEMQKETGWKTGRKPAVQ